MLCREALPGTRMWAALPAESTEQRGSLGGRKRYKGIMGGEGAQLCQVPALLPERGNRAKSHSVGNK